MRTDEEASEEMELDGEMEDMVSIWYPSWMRGQVIHNLTHMFNRRHLDRSYALTELDKKKAAQIQYNLSGLCGIKYKIRQKCSTYL
ncbi:hypothetical protein AMTR_s00128p00095650 [Amborella trichopoda]|uniref:Uncharacterized protein n=1 Tax=Amborella trichopoda TaxID=13333 RepID=W1NMU1_AMBTC|nr:hypothetical protein AMTR_s00128p00095650 [Amborella trichopoda]